MALEDKFNISNKIQDKNENCSTNDFLEEIENKDTSREQELKYLRELEMKFNLQERNEIELIKLEKRVKNIIIFDKLQEQKECKQLENNPKETKKMEFRESHKQTNIEKTQDENYAKRLNGKESYKIDSVRPKNNNYRNEFKRNRPNFQVYIPKPYKQRNFSENQQRTYRDGRGRSYSNHYKERLTLQNNYVFERPPGFQNDDKEKNLENHDYLLDLIPVTEDDEQKMLEEALELSKQQMFIERLQNKQLEKALQLDNEDKFSDIISEKKESTLQNTTKDELVSKEKTSPDNNINDKPEKKCREHLNHNDCMNTKTSIQANYSKNYNQTHSNKYNNFTRNNNVLHNKRVQNNRVFTHNPTKSTFRNLNNCDNTNISTSASTECKSKQNTSLENDTNNIYEQNNKNTSNRTRTDLKYDEISSKDNKFSKDSIWSQDKHFNKFSKGSKMDTAYQSTYSSKETRESHVRNSKLTDKNQTQESEENNNKVTKFDSNQKISTSKEITKDISVKNDCSDKCLKQVNEKTCNTSKEFFHHKRNFKQFQQNFDDFNENYQRDRQFSTSFSNTNYRNNTSDNQRMNWKPYFIEMESGRSYNVPPRFRKAYEQ